MATSVAGRGLDVKDCVLVINFSVPNHIEDYVHRVGGLACAVFFMPALSKID